MPSKDALDLLAGSLFVVSFGPYIWSILRKVNPAKPSKTSWLIWAISDTVILFGMYTYGTINGQIVGAVSGAWIVVALTMKYGMRTWTKLDKFCLSAAALGILLLIFGKALISVISGCVVVFVGAIPTFISAWQNPKSENRLAWTIAFLSSPVSLYGSLWYSGSWTFAKDIQTTTFLLVGLVMMYILYVRPYLSATAD